jgi:hypothetical protein
MRGISTPTKGLGAFVIALALAATACSGTATDTTVAAPDQTTQATQTTAVAPGDTTTTTTAGGTVTTGAGATVTASDGIDQETIDRLTVEVDELISETEKLRGLDFLAHPSVTILSTDELAARIESDISEELVPEELDVETRIYQLLGLLEPGDSLEDMLVSLYSEGVAGFYDGDTGEMVIGGEAAELTPYTKMVIVHELIHALTDQQFLFNDDYQAMFDEERYDQGAAFQALIEGDATYFQLVYFEQLPLAEQMSAAMEELDRLNAAPSYSSVPAWLYNSLAFPYETGRTFVASLVDAGGIAAVDDAYTNRPVSTEVVMHPARYEAGEDVLAVPPLDIAIPGYEVLETSSFGEWGLQLLLANSPAGVAVQATNGWGGDSYSILYDDNDVVLALAFKGDSDDDAFEMADALQGLVDSLGLGDPVGSGGGVAYNAEDGRYAYLDRIGDGFVFVISTDAGAGAAAVDQMRIP